MERSHSVRNSPPRLDLLDNPQHVVAPLLEDGEQGQDGGAQADAGGPPDPGLAVVDRGVPDLREEGLPIGLHIVGRFGDEPAVISASAAFERLGVWKNPRPPVA